MGNLDEVYYSRMFISHRLNRRKNGFSLKKITTTTGFIKTLSIISKFMKVLGECKSAHCASLPDALSRFVFSVFGCRLTCYLALQRRNLYT